MVKSVLVTGGNGYLGSHISKSLSESGFEVYSFCRTVPEDFAVKLPLVNLIQGDLADENSIKHLLKLSFDAIVHTVSLDHKQSETYDLDVVNQINIQTLWKLLDGFSNKGVKKFIYLSTQHVLGPLPVQVVNESYQGIPVNKYGLTHAIGEQLCTYYSNRSPMECVNLRLSNGYGAPVFDESNWSWLVINDLTAMAYFNHEIVLQSDGSPIRDFIHVSDIARAVGHFLHEEKSIPTVVNISSGTSYTMLELAHQVKALFQSKYQIEVPIYISGNIRSEVAPNHLGERVQVDNSKLLGLGFKFNVDLNQGISDLFEYFEKRSNA